MTADTAAPFEHPLRSRNDVPRSDVRRVTSGLADALDAMLAAHAPAAGVDKAEVLDISTPEKKRVVEELARCLGGRVNVKGVAVGDVVVQLVCEDEAGAAAICAVVNHTGLAGKASWFKGDDDAPWVALIIPSR